MGCVGAYEVACADGWRGLPAGLRDFHAAQAARGVGAFRVRRGGWWARVVAVMMRLPVEGDDVAVTLSVERDGVVEIWRRVFGGRVMETRQWIEEGRLVERMGAIELVFELIVEAGALVFRHVRSRLKIGPIRIPWPRSFGRVEAREREESDGVLGVDVKISAPVVGLIVAYEGTLRVERVEEAA